MGLPGADVDDSDFVEIYDRDTVKDVDESAGFIVVG